jgi:hypothetical protein
MNRISLTFLFGCVAALHASWGQLHLVTGSPWTKGTASYPSVLLRLDDGNITAVAGLVHSTVGTDWIGASYDWRKVVLLSRDFTIVVLDFDTATKVKSCKMPDPKGRSLIRSWLAEDPAGQSFEWYESGDDPVKDGVVQRMLLDPAKACDQSLAQVEPEAIRHVVAHGSPGIVDLVNRDGLVNQTSNSTGAVNVAATKWVPLGYTVPEPLRRNMDSPDIISELEVNDAKALVLTLFGPGNRYRTLVYRKSDKTWHMLPNRGDEHPMIRGFGKYIALTEVLAKSPQNPESAGMDKWIPGKDRVNPDLRERIVSLDDHHPLVYPGILHLYNIDTEQMISISTKQGDSEVLLIEDGIVYYRSADQLFSAPILRDRIGTARLLATDDAIRDAHWAFIKR